MGVNSETNIKFLGKQMQEKIAKLKKESNELRDELTHKLETQYDKLTMSIRHLG
jgi:predicted nuclease with TOPRIM domain